MNGDGIIYVIAGIAIIIYSILLLIVYFIFGTIGIIVTVFSTILFNMLGSKRSFELLGLEKHNGPVIELKLN